MDFSLGDEIKLISLVAENPCLYDSSDPNYRKMAVTVNVWTRISKQLNKKVHYCKEKWRRIRDEYSRAQKKATLGIGPPSSWICKHHEQLSSFLFLNTKYTASMDVGCGFVEISNSELDLQSENPQQNATVVLDSDLNADETVVSDKIGDSVDPVGENERRLSKRVNNHIVDKNVQRSSKREKHKVSVNGAADEDIVAEILKEEQELLEMYRKQKNTKRSKSRRRGPAKRRRPNVGPKTKIIPNEEGFNVNVESINEGFDQNIMQNEDSGQNLRQNTVINENLKKKDSIPIQTVVNNDKDVSQNNLSNNADDIELFCRYIGSVMRKLSPIQKAVAKKDLNSVLSHYEIVAARNGEPSAGGLGPQGGLDDRWGFMTSTRMEGLAMLTAPPTSSALRFSSN